jgi:TM2 domain-containing membrane protein YozV
MKTLRLALLLTVSLLLSNVSGFAYVVAPQSATATVTYEDASGAALNSKEMKKQQKKEARAQKRAERRVKFLAWFQKLADSDQLVAILLAFFLGGLGIHRVYLGSQPIIILWYIITFFGIFGIIPLIDFIRLILGQVDHYRDNDSLIRAFQAS